MAHVLIVEGDETAANPVIDLLLDAGHACSRVTCVSEAERWLSWRMPDVILLNKDMPGECGVSLLGMLRSSPERCALPVLAYFSMTDSDGGAWLEAAT